MKSVLRVILCAVMIDAAFSPLCRAQGESLGSDPPGAYLSLEGPVSVSGVAPLPLSYLTPGSYSLKARGSGLAAARGKVRLDENGLEIRAWAGPSAMLQPPGLVHLMRGEARGWHYLGAATLSGVLWWVNDNSADDAPDGSTERVDERRIRDLWAGYFGAVWLGAGIESWLLTPQPRITSLGSGRYVAVLPRSGGLRAAFRSLLAPGSGQRYAGRSNRAAFFSTMVAASAAAAIFAQDAFLEAQREGRSDEDSKDVVRWVITGSAATFYLWNIVDAFSAGRNPEGSVARAPAPAMAVVPTSSGVAISMSWRFP